MTEDPADAVRRLIVAFTARVKMPPERAVYVVRDGRIVSAQFGVPA